MNENQLYTIILRHDSSTNWDINDPILAYGEYGVEDDTHRVKRGNGVNNWSQLPYETFGVDINLNASDIKFNNKHTSLEATNIQDALIEIYNKLNNL